MELIIDWHGTFPTTVTHGLKKEENIENVLGHWGPVIHVIGYRYKLYYV